jgi:hypothetical protein
MAMEKSNESLLDRLEQEENDNGLVQDDKMLHWEEPQV